MKKHWSMRKMISLAGSDCILFRSLSACISVFSSHIRMLTQELDSAHRVILKSDFTLPTGLNTFVHTGSFLVNWNKLLTLRGIV